MDFLGYERSDLIQWKLQKGQGGGITRLLVKNGQPQKHQSYKGGMRDGIWWEAFQNGQKKFEGSYLEGEKHGIWNYWKENGEKTKFEKYQNGLLVEN